ncbi:MAG TPA: MerR family transcriptional regulator [Bacillales bacterium]|nr:MerR family transcriptional regulator [Bacillales bacterium]
MLVKTKTVSNTLNVNPSTIQRWVKHFNLPCKRNDHGHLLYSEQDIETLKQIKTQLAQGLSMDDVTLSLKETKVSETVPTSCFEKKLDRMVAQIHALEDKLSQKADEVVSVQLYQHRNELDDLTKTIDRVENRLETIEAQLSDFAPAKEQHLEESENRKRGWLVGIFGT